MKTARTRRWLAVALLGLIGIAGCGGKDGAASSGQPKKAPLVSVRPVEVAPISREVELTGEVVAVNSVVIAATVEGPVEYLPWREGDRIERAGQKLVEINRELYRSEVKAAEAALGVARAKLEDMKAGTRPEEIAKARDAVRQLEESAAFAQLDYERMKTLFESGSGTRESLEKARVENVTQQAKLSSARQHLAMLEAGYTKTEIAVQEAIVNEAAAKLGLAKSRLDECVIFAPFAGTVTRVFVRPGDMAATKSPLLELADMSSLVVRVAVPEAHASEVREGMAAVIRLDAVPGKVFQGKIVRAYPGLDPRMRTRTVELALETPAVLMPGMFARVKLIIESVPDALVVPREAVLVTPAGGQVAFVVEDGKALARKVRTGIEQGDRVQVLAGLKAGEKVVVAGNEKLKDGVEVRVPEPKKSPGPPAAAAGGTPGKGGGAQ